MPEEEKDSKTEELRLEHRHNYVGGAFAYKNSSKSPKLLDPENFQEMVLMIGLGKARPVRISAPAEETRVGIYPQHNSAEDFRENTEIVESKALESYQKLHDIHDLEKLSYKQLLISMPKERLVRCHAQFAHLSKFAFHQMMGIPNPDKRDFDVWAKKIEKSRQVIMVYPYKKTGLTIFVQVVDYAEDLQTITGIKHCTFDQGKPLVINETLLDRHLNVRQLAHLGVKGSGLAYNSVERFDDGTVAWTITLREEASKLTGMAALRPDDTIVIIGGDLNEASSLAAKNLGAEDIKDDKWTGVFSREACKPESHPMQKTFKETVRKQIGQIVDGATIPGLMPIFQLDYSKL